MAQQLFDAPYTERQSFDGLARTLCADLSDRWKSGQRPDAASYLVDFPPLEQDAPALLRLVYEEMCLHEEYGMPIPLARMCEQFPQLQAELEALMYFHRLLKS